MLSVHMEINIQKYSPKYICTCVKINLHLVPTKCKFTHVSKCAHMDEFGHENGALVTVFILTDTHERGNTGQLYVCFVLLWKLNQELRKRLLSFYWVFKKKNVQDRYKYLFREGQILFCERKKRLLLWQKFSETYIIKIFEIFIDNILVMFSGRLFNRQSTFLWVPTALIFLPTWFFIRMRQYSSRGFSKRT